MDLLPAVNLLPRDGTVIHFGRVVSDADSHFDSLLADIPWRHDELVMFGKRVVTARQVAWFADAEISYTYSGATKRGLPWTERLAALKSLAETITGESYNSCLLNLYQDGAQGMGWHSDDEKSIAPDSAIASLSLGAKREFRLKHKVTGERVSIRLEHGSLLVMKDATQRHWLHAIPKTAMIKEPRINLTFRKMV